MHKVAREGENETDVTGWVSLTSTRMVSEGTKKTRASPTTNLFMHSPFFPVHTICTQATTYSSTHTHSFPCTPICTQATTTHSHTFFPVHIICTQAHHMYARITCTHAPHMYAGTSYVRTHHMYACTPHVRRHIQFAERRTLEPNSKMRMVRSLLHVTSDVPAGWKSRSLIGYT